jgi:SNF2 family DNA or RNA helicase
MRLVSKHAEAYERIRRNVEDKYSHAATLVALSQLRMFCSHPWLLGLCTDDPVQEWPKYQRLLEILDEIFLEGEKALVFSGYTEMIDIIVSDLHRRFGYTHIDWIDGRVVIAERQSRVDRFSATSRPGVLVLNPRAAGTGLNITAASHIIHYTPEWNPAVQDQASARAYRRGQTRPVTVHQLFCVDTVEEVIVERLDVKRALVAGAAPETATEPEAADILNALRRSPLSTNATNSGQHTSI